MLLQADISTVYVSDHHSGPKQLSGQGQSGDLAGLGRPAAFRKCTGGKVNLLL